MMRTFITLTLAMALAELRAAELVVPENVRLEKNIEFANPEGDF